MDAITPPEKNAVTAYEPEKPLRKIIGAHTNLSAIFTKDRIASCQDMINEAQNSFFDDIGEEFANLEQAVAHATQSTSGESEQFETIGRLAYNICGHARLFNFPLITKLCEHIIDNCESNSRQAQTRLSLIMQLTQALRLAIKNKIVNEGGEIGRELLAQLRY